MARQMNAFVARARVLSQFQCAWLLTLVYGVDLCDHRWTLVGVC